MLEVPLETLGNTEGLAWFKWDGLLRLYVKRSEYASEHLVLEKVASKNPSDAFFFALKQMHENGLKMTKLSRKRPSMQQICAAAFRRSSMP